MPEQNDAHQIETASLHEELSGQAKETNAAETAARPSQEDDAKKPPKFKPSEKMLQEEYLSGVLFFLFLGVILLASMVIYAFAHGINFFRLWTDPTLTFQVDFIGGKKNAFSMGMEISVWTFWGVSCRTAYTALKAMLKGKFRFFKYLVIWCGTVGFAWGVSVALIFSLSVVTFTVGATKVTLADASIEMLMAVAFIIGFYNEWALKMLEQVRDQLTGGLEGEPPKK